MVAREQVEVELWQYPRPKDDTGIGVHWSAGVDAKAVGLPKIRDRWLPELKAMGVKWVKILHLGGQDLAELFLAHDIMPVVRLFRRQRGEAFVIAVNQDHVSVLHISHRSSSIKGLTSTAPRRASGILAAHSIAWSRLSHSSM